MNKIAIVLLMLIATAFAVTEDVSEFADSDISAEEPLVTSDVESAVEDEEPLESSLEEDSAVQDEDADFDYVKEGEELEKSFNQGSDESIANADDSDDDYKVVEQEYKELADEEENVQDADGDMGRPVCVSSGDPHIMNFFRQRFDVYNIRNQWVTMLRYKHLSIQAYQIMQGPWGHRSMNRYVRVLYKNRQIRFVHVNHNIHINLPYGFSLHTRWHRHRHWWWNDIHVWAPNMAVAKASKGLCHRHGHGHKWIGWIHRADAIRRKSDAVTRRALDGHCHRLRGVNYALYYDCIYDMYQMKINELATCYSAGDPHYRSFFGRGFNIYNKQGWLTLYKKGNMAVKTYIQYMKPWRTRGLNTKVAIFQGNKKIRNFTLANTRNGYKRHQITKFLRVDIRVNQWRNYRWIDVWVNIPRLHIKTNEKNSSGACFHGGHLQNWAGWLKKANKVLKKIPSASQRRNIRNWCNRERRHTGNTHLTFYDCVVDKVQNYKTEKLVCRSTGDPHITTFDRRTWHLYNKEGWFVLFAYKNLKVRTHINFTQRWGTRGVNDHVQVLVNNKVTANWNANVRGHVRKNLPYGFKLALNRNAAGNTRWIDVYITGLAHKALKSTGLCRHRGHLNNNKIWLQKARKILDKIKNSKERFEIQKRCHAHRGWGFSYYYDCVFDKYTFYVKGHRYGNKHRNAHKYVVKKLHKKHTSWFHAGNHAFLRHLRHVYLQKLKRYRATYHHRIAHMKKTILRTRTHYKKVLRHNLHVRHVTVVRTTRAIKHARRVIKKTTHQWNTKKAYYWGSLLRELHHAHLWYKKIRAIYVKKQQALVKKRLDSLRGKFKYNSNPHLVLKYCFARHKNVHSGAYANCVNKFQAQCKVVKKRTKVCQRGKCTFKTHLVQNC